VHRLVADRDRVGDEDVVAAEAAAERARLAGDDRVGEGAGGRGEQGYRGRREGEGGSHGEDDLRGGPRVRSGGSLIFRAGISAGFVRLGGHGDRWTGARAGGAGSPGQPRRVRRGGG